MFSKLAALEAASGQQSELTHADKKLLVSLLGRRDAMMWPWRWSLAMSDRFPEIVRRQKEYLSGEAGLPVKAQGRADWKTSSERRQRLIDAGMVAGVSSGGQVLSLFLTLKGEAVARALVAWVATLDECTPVLRRLFDLSGGKPNVPIRESMVWQNPCTGNPQDWNYLTERILPALTAGVVRATSCTQGRISYSIVAGATIPEQVSVDQQAEEWASDLYLSTFNAERASLESCVARNGLEIWIPLPATGWGSHYGVAE